MGLLGFGLVYFSAVEVADDEQDDSEGDEGNDA